MKKLKITLTLALLAISGALLAGPVRSDSVQVVDSCNMNLFILSADRSMKGAEVEIHHANGDLISNLKLRKRKLIIDFCKVKFGTYVIVVKTSGRIQEFTFKRKLIISDVPR